MIRKDPRRGEGRSPTWATFVRNHANSVVAADFLTVITVRFQILYVLVVMEIESRRILHVNVTAHPTCRWVSQQFREALPFQHPYRFLILDRDVLFSPEARTTIHTSASRFSKLRPELPKPTLSANDSSEPFAVSVSTSSSLSPRTISDALSSSTGISTIGEDLTPRSDPGVPEPSEGVPAPLLEHRHLLPENARIVSIPILGGLHHDYRLDRDAA